MKRKLFKSKEPSEFYLDRAKIRLDGFGHYAGLSILFINAALRLKSSTPTKLDDRTDENIVKIAFVSLNTACMVMGCYTATVFSFISLYGKTFIGMKLDAEYMEFFKQTADIRQTAFYSFVGTMLSFNMSLVLSLYLSNSGKVRYWLAIATAVVIAIGAQNWFLIMQYASVLFH